MWYDWNFHIEKTNSLQLEWLTSIPWPNSTPIPSSSAAPQPQQLVRDKTFLTAARTQLDADHFGLEKIKKRLIEYLAVVRLKEMNAEKEAREEERKQQTKPADAKDGAEKAESKALVPYQKQPQPSPQSGPSRPSRLGKKGVKGPILLYACIHSLLEISLLTIPIHNQFRWTSGHRQDVSRTVCREGSRAAVPADLLGWCTR